MKLSKTIPALAARTETVNFMWVQKNFTEMNNRYRLIREKCGDTMLQCGWCDHKFKNGEIIGLGGIAGKTNMALCQKCATEAEEENERS